MKVLQAVSAIPIIMAAGCAHTVDVTKTTIAPNPSALYQASNANAQATCEAQYANKKQNFLSAIQNHIANKGPGAMAGRVPLDGFRAEINAAYNMVVSRCKTHIRCLEAHGYDESRCYIAAYDRKDAERAFSDLAVRLRDLAQKQAAANAKAATKGAGKKKQSTNVTVETTIKQVTEQKDHQEMNVDGCCKDKDAGKGRRRR